MKFSGIPPSSVVKIYTLLGELVRQLDGDAGGIALWNGKNDYGQDVASKVYLAVIEGGGETKVVKIAVQR
jgi:hypothetical protein